MDIFQNKVTEHDWPEHFQHENGNYNRVCHTCTTKFIAHKRTVLCKKCFIEGLKSKITTLEQQLAQEQWIPVSERLPNHNKDVIVRYVATANTGKVLEPNFNKDWFDEDEFFNYGTLVTHWKEANISEVK